MRASAVGFAVGLAFALPAVVLLSQSASQPARAVTDPGVITTRQAITPAGVQSVFDGRVFGVTFGETDDELWVLTGRTQNGRPRVYQLDWLQNRVRNQWDLSGTPALQGLVFDPVRKSPLVGHHDPAASAGNRAGGAVQLLQHDGQGVRPAGGGSGPASRRSAGARAQRGTRRPRRAAARLRQRAGDRRRRRPVGDRGTVKTDGVAPFGAAHQPRRRGRMGQQLGWTLAEGG